MGRFRLLIVVIICLASGGCSIAANKGSLSPMRSLWSEVTFKLGPEARDGAAATYVPGEGMLVFGGEAAGAIGFNDTWVWNGTSWRELNDSVHPPALVGAAMAYDPALKEVVLFGGASETGQFNGTTWLWTVSHGWTVGRTSPALTGRMFAAMTYDGADGDIYMFGGFVNLRTHLATDQLWRWSVAGWRLVEAYGLPALAEASLAFDVSTRQLLIVGGVESGGVRVTNESWVAGPSTDTWRSVSNAGLGVRAGASCVYAPSLQGVVVFGGWELTSAPTGTWLWRDSRWSKIATGRTPPPRSEAVMTFDSSTNVVVLFSGSSPALVPRGDMWLLTTRS